MPKERILIVDDEEDILELLHYNLGKEGYDIIRAATGEQAVEQAKSQKPDLVILDLMLPGIDGLTVCRILQSNDATGRIPIIMLTAKGEESDVVAGLELGAEDYVTKPFSQRVLLARVRTALRRHKTAPVDESDVLRIHEITIDPGRHRVDVNGLGVDLTLTEFRILHALARRPGWVFTRYQLVEASRGEDAEITDRAVDVHIVSLRRKLGPAGGCIETVRGVGYRFKEGD
jgi:two-component system, OmpR family, alkaline phosphatase synthesis response regulator PhoP